MQKNKVITAILRWSNSTTLGDKLICFIKKG